jgi:hypothetical protein
MPKGKKGAKKRAAAGVTPEPEPAEDWVCAECEQENDAADLVCAACEEPRPMVRRPWQDLCVRPTRIVRWGRRKLDRGSSC